MKKLFYLTIILLSFACNPFVTKHNTGIEKGVVERDEAIHAKNSLEWWYVTGFLNGDDGKRYGIEYVFFHFRPFDRRLRYMVNVAITSPEDSVFVYDYEVFKSKNRLNSGLPLNFSTPLYDWRGQFGKYELQANMKRHNAGFNLTTEPTQPVVLHQDSGYVNYGNIAKAGYYSYPQLKTGGELYLNGDTVKVEGFTWYDRQWDCGNVTANNVAWDWTAINLSDSSELMLYRVDSKKEGREIFGGTYIASNNETMILQNEDVIMTPIEFWKSPKTKKKYPVKWTVEIPKLKFNVTMRAEIPNQELVIGNWAKTVKYWEGMCVLEGTKNGKPIRGESYLEMTNK